MHYPEAYTDYLIYFHAQRDFFECHEVMEEYWKEHPGDERSSTYVGLIQIAVGVYHERRGNRAGALKMLQSAASNLNPGHVRALGLDPDKLQTLLASRIERIRSHEGVYEDMNLPIADAGLLAYCLRECEERGLTWLMPSAMDNEQLIHRHTLRDRTEVIRERELQKQRRQKRSDDSA